MRCARTAVQQPIFPRPPANKDQNHSLLSIFVRHLLAKQIASKWYDVGDCGGQSRNIATPRFHRHMLVNLGKALWGTYKP